MLSFESDYIEGCHPEILRRLSETNMEQLSGYGSDCYTESAKKKIAKACGIDNFEQIYFLVGGTQTNQIIADTVLKPYEGVIAAVSGHINAHEAGAIEYTGHKVLPLPSHEGKIDALELKEFLSEFYADENSSHMVYPGMVYISYPTEYGTLYTKRELSTLSAICRENHISLFLDGARLGYGLESPDSDMTLKDIASLTDVFYIGGTKVGSLCGEAVVFTKDNMPEHFTTLVKKHGALLAKGRLLGIQFDTLFTDDLYFKISAHAIEMANLLRSALVKKYDILMDPDGHSVSNQIFVILRNSEMQKLKEKVAFSFWEKYDESHTVARFATSWATKKEDVEKLIDLL